ncbi:MAG: hypothetical protein ACOWW1_05030 [archaeon]
MRVFKLSIIFVPILIALFAMGITASPFWFSFLIIGQFLGVYVGFFVLAVILIVAPILLFLIFFPKKNVNENAVQKTGKGLRTKTVVLSVIIAFLIVSLLDVAVLGLVSTSKRDEFVNQNQGEDLETLVDTIHAFLKSNLTNCYNEPEGAFKIDNYVCVSIFDSEIMKLYGLTRADIILFHGWETCGQTAVVTSQLLSDLGFDARRARWIGRDHEWAEVIYNGEWVTFDQMLGYLKEIGDLGTRYIELTGVEVQYQNGTIIDMSAEHGYVSDE